MESLGGAVRVGVRVTGIGTTGPGYATVTIDDNGRIVLANTCAEHELYERLGRRSPTERQMEEMALRRQRIEEQKQNLEDVKEATSAISRFLFGKKDSDTSSEPAKCPNCGISNHIFRRGWKKLDDGVYNCYSCGYKMNVHAGAEHVHRHEYPSDGER
jgi:predicted RNA-binding Zn-ribbon protein involved in translation (DUF1610 family)